jgi:SAM-dependent methyltransferase
MSVFKRYSQYYDLLYKDKNYQAEVDYITKIISNNAPNAKTILDLGSGTGIHDYILAQKGFKVTGVDFSNEMIDEANIKLKTEFINQKDNLIFDVGDARSWKSKNKYDIVVSLFHVMSYQISNDDIKKVLLTAKEHLKEGGLFIFDFWYGPGVLNNPPETRIKRLENEIIQVTRLAESDIYPNENLVDVNYTILVKDKIDNETEEIKETHRMRYLFFPEIKLFAECVNAKSINLYEWLSLDAPTFNSWTACVVIRF